MAMIMGELTRSGHRSTMVRYLKAFALLACLLWSLTWLTGCENVPGAPPFEQPPAQEIPTWFFAIWGTGPADIYVVGQPGLIYHLDGTTWQKQPSGTRRALIDVWGRAANDVFICGHGGTILHNNGTGWEAMDSGSNKDFYGLGTYQGAVHACGKDGVLRRFSGGTWVNTGNFMVRRNPDGTAVIDTLYRNDDVLSLTTVTYHGIAGNDGIVLMEDPDADWLVRLVAAGAEWVLAGLDDPNDQAKNYLVTDGGRLFQLQAEGTWLELSGLAPSETPLTGIWADAGDTLYFSTRTGQIARRNPAGLITTMYAGPMVLYDIWGTAPDNIYTVGIDGTVLHYDGEQWETVDVGLPATKSAPASPPLDKFGRPLR